MYQYKETFWRRDGLRKSEETAHSKTFVNTKIIKYVSYKTVVFITAELKADNICCFTHVLTSWASYSLRANIPYHLHSCIVRSTRQRFEEWNAIHV
jgi:hypothetical protein